jgi:competence protein ComEA
MTRALLPLALLAACSAESASTDAIRLDWRLGDEFHLATSRREAAAKSPHHAVALDAPFSGAPLGDAWTPEAVWRWQVIEEAMTPTDGDELLPFATDRQGRVHPLDVIKVSLNRAATADAGLLESDPVVYLVFRADRDRLAAMVSFTNQGGRRVQRALSSGQLDRSWSALTQSDLSDVPALLAPFSARFEEESLVLENGSTLSTHLLDDDTVEATYADELGGGTITSTYERGTPWPTFSASANVTVRLLTDGEVGSAARTAARAAFADEPPPDFDYRAALSATIDIDASLVLDEETRTEGWTQSVYDEFRPWPGSWWPLKESAIVFGYDGRDTFSDRVAATIKTEAERRDDIQTELRTLKSTDPKYNQLVTEYNTLTDAEVDKLVAFYDDLRADLDGGQLRISGGKLTHNDGWSYDLDELSPFDKFGLAEHLRGADINNPFYLSAWEILNAYNPKGGSWWGKCNGWSASAILANEPQKPVVWTAPDGTELSFTTADQKGLLATAFYSTDSRFYGQRYNGPEQDITDLSPKAFHHIIDHYLRRQRIPFVFDTDAGDAVWNFPVVEAMVDVRETTPRASGSASSGTLVNVNVASVAEIDAIPNVSTRVAEAVVRYRTDVRPFQTVDELIEVYGIGSSTLSKMRPYVTVQTTAATERTFEVTVLVSFENDGVEESYVSTQGPTTFDETWSYTLVTDPNGQVLRGTWAVAEEHPDFAWVPYNNPRTRASGSSENPFLEYGALLDVLGEDLERK